MRENKLSCKHNYTMIDRSIYKGTAQYIRCTIMCLRAGTINFPSGAIGKLMVLAVPIIKHFRVGKHTELCYSKLYCIFILNSISVILG